MITVAKVPEKSKSRFRFIGKVAFWLTSKYFVTDIYIYICPQDNNAAVLQSLACIFVTQLFYRLWLVKGDS